MNEIFAALVLERPAAPRPAGDSLGFAMVHNGSWELFQIAEEPVPFPVASTVSEGGEVCEARVIRARHLYATMSDPDDDRRALETSYLALELEGCPAGGAIGTAPVTAQRLDPTTAGPARDELAALIATVDAPFASDSWRIDGEVRALELPARELAVVFGHRRWVVNHGVVLGEHYFGDPAVLVEAGPEVFFVMTSPSEGWLSSLADFHPLRPDGSHRTYCVVRDDTPLNVRAEPSAEAAVREILQNGTEVEALAEERGWVRVGQPRDSSPIGWAHHGGVECNGPIPRE